MIGIQANQDLVNRATGQNNINLKNEFDRAERIRNFLINNNDTVLSAEPFNYNADEIFALRALYDQIETLRVAYNNIPQVALVIGLGQ